MSGPRPRYGFLGLAELCGAILTGKPDGSEAVSVVFSIEAWRTFDKAVALRNKPRQSGRTQKQMLSAPFHSFYIWQSVALDYPVELARHIGRGDLQVRSSGWLEGQTLAGLDGRCVFLDHAVRLNEDVGAAVWGLKASGAWVQF